MNSEDFLYATGIVTFGFVSSRYLKNRALLKMTKIKYDTAYDIAKLNYKRQIHLDQTNLEIVRTKYLLNKK